MVPDSIDNQLILAIIGSKSGTASAFPGALESSGHKLDWTLPYIHFFLISIQNHEFHDIIVPCVGNLLGEVEGVDFPPYQIFALINSGTLKKNKTAHPDTHNS